MRGMKIHNLKLPAAADGLAGKKKGGDWRRRPGGARRGNEEARPRGRKKRLSRRAFREERLEQYLGPRTFPC